MAGAEALVEDGRYAMRSAEGWRTLDQPLVANGPGVVLPVALSMRLFGVGLWQARVPATLFMVAFGLIVYLVARKLSGPAGGLAALAIVLAMPHQGFLYFGRMAMGNVPALAYFSSGLLIWIAARRQRRIGPALAAGLLFGLAATTKAQWSIVLLPALALTWIVDRAVLGERRAADLVAAAVSMVAVIAGWHLVQWTLLGSAGYLVQSAGVHASSRWTVFALDPVRFTPGSLHYLVRSGIAAVWVTAIAYTIRLCVERHAMAVHAVLLAAVATVWYAWYALVSVGWQRYAFEPTMLSAILAGAALGRSRELWSAAPRNRSRVAHWLAAAAAGAVVGYVVVHSARRVAELAAAPDQSAQEFAAYLETRVSPAAAIESWEWQLDVLTDHTVYHPTNNWVDDYTAQVFAAVPVTRAYPWRDRGPEYLVDGPFSKFTGIYARDLLAGCCTLDTSRGPYDLYRVLDRRVSGAPPRRSIVRDGRSASAVH